MTQYPEDFKDDLEAYPLRLNVAALPDRRFFKMTRTLTIGVVLLSALLIVLGVFLNYQITHLDVTVRRRGTWQFYHIDPIEKKLKPVESVSMKLDPLRLVVEERLREYLKDRNSTIWDEDAMTERFGDSGLIAQMTHKDLMGAAGEEIKAMRAQTRGSGLVRDVHIYDLKMMDRRWWGSAKKALWMAIIEVFDLPMVSDWQGTACPCSDNSKSCLDCKIKNAKRRERLKIWLKTSFSRPKECIVTEQRDRCKNPLGISVDKYVPAIMPIHADERYWDLPAALQPEL